jgi:hypothetical protein
MLTEDLTAFFDAGTSGLAQQVQVDGVARAAIFDAEHQLGGLAVAGIAAAQPMLLLPTAHVPASPVGKAAVVNAVTYTIVEHQPDGTGVSRLMLERA